eukprot:UN12091
MLKQLNTIRQLEEQQGNTQELNRMCLHFKVLVGHSYGNHQHPDWTCYVLQ